MTIRQPLREPINVDDAKQRDKLVRRFKNLRDGLMLDIATIEHYNKTYPDEAPISTEFERALVKWIDGEGPMPAIVIPKKLKQRRKP